jgi:hypothetical protein
VGKFLDSVRVHCAVEGTPVRRVCKRVADVDIWIRSNLDKCAVRLKSDLRLRRHLGSDTTGEVIQLLVTYGSGVLQQLRAGFRRIVHLLLRSIASQISTQIAHHKREDVRMPRELFRATEAGGGDGGSGCSQWVRRNW